MAKLSVSGKFINEISHNVPSSKFAIIELIKNAYEAGAKSVCIEVSKDKIVICDSGNGMTESDIDSLLIISHSKKTFGEEIDGRLVSGEKGLGFFSSFKFGSILEVITYNKNECLKFKLDREEIVNVNSLYDLDVPVDKLKKSNNHKTGTEISISKLNVDTLTLFNKILTDEVEYSKLLNVIDDPNFVIHIKNNNSTLIHSQSNPNLEAAKLAFATFNSSEKQHDKHLIKLNRNGVESTIEVDSRFDRLFKEEGFSLDISINLYNFATKTVNKNHVSKLYHDNKRGCITPIIYINNSLFDNYTLYDIEVNASKKSSLVFRQQTGKVKIFLRKPEILTFNSDRTQLNESINQSQLKEFLDFFSSKIQIELRSILDEEKGANGSPPKQTITSGETPNNKLKNKNNDINKNDDVDKNNQTKNDESGKIDANSQKGIKVNLLVKKFEVLKEYSFKEIFSFTDSNGGQKVRPTTELKIEPENIVTLQNNKQVLTFTAPCELVIFKFELEDKTTKARQCVEFSGESIIRKLSNKKRIVNNGFIEAMVFSEDGVKHDIFQFKNELNELHKSDKFTNIFVAGIRTFIELAVSDIMDHISESKETSLNDNYQKLISEQFIKSTFIDTISDERDKKGINSLYDNLKKENQLLNLINLLNLTTHNGSRLIGIEEIKSKRLAINFIYLYLCFVSQQIRK